MHKYIALVLTCLLHYDIIQLQSKANEMIVSANVQSFT